MFKWLTNLIDQRVVRHHHNNKGRWTVNLSFEDKHAIRKEIIADYGTSLTHTVDAITEEAVKEYVEKVLDEVTTRTEVIEKVVERVNNVQLKERT